MPSTSREFINWFKYQLNANPDTGPPPAPGVVTASTTVPVAHNQMNEMNPLDCIHQNLDMCNWGQWSALTKKCELYKVP